MCRLFSQSAWAEYVFREQGNGAASKCNKKEKKGEDLRKDFGPCIHVGHRVRWAPRWIFCSFLHLLPTPFSWSLYVVLPLSAGAILCNLEYVSHIDDSKHVNHPHSGFSISVGSTYALLPDANPCMCVPVCVHVQVYVHVHVHVHALA